MLSNQGHLGPLRCGFLPSASNGDSSSDAESGGARAYVAEPLLRAVESPIAQLLELQRLPVGVPLAYAASRNRQCHTYSLMERRDKRSPALKRVFLRCDILIYPACCRSRSLLAFMMPCTLRVAAASASQQQLVPAGLPACVQISGRMGSCRGVVRQLGRPALLAAMYSGDGAGAATAAMEEIEAVLVSWLAELERAGAVNSAGNYGQRLVMSIPVLNLMTGRMGSNSAVCQHACPKNAAEE